MKLVFGKASLHIQPEKLLAIFLVIEEFDYNLLVKPLWFSIPQYNSIVNTTYYISKHGLYDLAVIQ